MTVWLLRFVCWILAETTNEARKTTPVQCNRCDVWVHYSYVGMQVADVETSAFVCIEQEVYLHFFTARICCCCFFHKKYYKSYKIFSFKCRNTFTIVLNRMELLVSCSMTFFVILYLFYLYIYFIVILPFSIITIFWRTTIIVFYFPIDRSKH